MQVIFTCGHTVRPDAKAESAPVCPTCGNRTIERVEVRPPRFTGAASGPHVETRDLPAVPVSLKD